MKTPKTPKPSYTPKLPAPRIPHLKLETYLFLLEQLKGLAPGEEWERAGICHGVGKGFLPGDLTLRAALCDIFPFWEDPCNNTTYSELFPIHLIAPNAPSGAVRQFDQVVQSLYSSLAPWMEEYISARRRLLAFLISFCEQEIIALTDWSKEGPRAKAKLLRYLELRRELETGVGKKAFLKNYWPKAWPRLLNGDLSHIGSYVYLEGQDSQILYGYYLLDLCPASSLSFDYLHSSSYTIPTTSATSTTP